MVNINIMSPVDIRELQSTIRKAITNKQKILLKENLELQSLPIDAKTVILDLSSFDKIIELDKENFTVTVEGGINFLEFQIMLAQKGFFFPLDTYASAKTSLSYNVLHGLPSYTLGEYGNYREYVLGLEAVLFNGDHIKIGGKNIKNVSGLDIIGLLIGSKETLGIITKLTLRLLPFPEEKRVLLFNFKELKTALHVTNQLINKGINPAKLHILNASGNSIIKNINLSKSPVVIAEIDGFKASLPRQLDVFKEIISGHISNFSLEITDNNEITNFWNNFREAQYQALINVQNTVSFSCIISEIPEMVAEIEKELVKFEQEFIIQVNGIVGTGMVIPLKKVDNEWISQVAKLIEKYDGKVLGKKSFVNQGLNTIHKKLIDAFDPARISFLGGEEF
ncbi:MAG: glycolate oxidase [Clostridia bacterium]|jgi:glycolate oxidase|nr:glycolate oxidase [Clostridia bacterium]